MPSFHQVLGGRFFSLSDFCPAAPRRFPQNACESDKGNIATLDFSLLPIVHFVRYDSRSPHPCREFRAIVA